MYRVCDSVGGHEATRAPSARSVSERWPRDRFGRQRPVLATPQLRGGARRGAQLARCFRCCHPMTLLVSGMKTSVHRILSRPKLSGVSEGGSIVVVVFRDRRVEERREEQARVLFS